MITSLLLKLSDNKPLSEDEDDYHWELKSHAILLSELKMLLMSRARLPDIEDIPLVNSSVINYGISETFSEGNEINVRRFVLEKRIKNSISRFEPRLSQVSVTGIINDSRCIRFILRGIFLTTHIEFEMMWDDCTGSFFFNE